MPLACGRNRSKYQPKGHFDAAVGGRRRHQKAAAGTAFEKLRQRRLQQAALTGGPRALNRLNRLHVILTHSAFYTLNLASYPATSCCSLHVKGDPVWDHDSWCHVAQTGYLASLLVTYVTQYLSQAVVTSTLLLVTGAGTAASDADVPVSVSAEAKSSEAADLRTSNRSGNRRRRFVDDQAAGGDSSRSDGDADSSSPNEHPQRQHDPQLSRGQAAANVPIDITSHGSSSSENDLPLASKRHRSRSLPRQSQSSDSDSFSSQAGSPSKLADIETRSMLPVSRSTAVDHQQRVQKQRTGASKSGKLPEADLSSRVKRIRQHSQAVSQDTNTQPDAPTPTDAMASLPPPHSRVPRASSLGRGSSPQEGEAAEMEDGEDGSAGVHEEEEAAAFEVPSQMPRELQSWAWDK